MVMWEECGDSRPRLSASAAPQVSYWRGVILSAAVLQAAKDLAGIKTQMESATLLLKQILKRLPRIVRS
jgi:hypothetical protein